MFGNLTDVKIVPDPLQRHDLSIPVQVIEQDNQFWGTFIFIVYIKFVRYIVSIKRENLLDCRTDEKFKYLCVDVGSWIFELNAAMCECLQRVPRRKTEYDSKKDWIKSIFAVLCRLFILDRAFQDALGSQSNADKSTREERRRIYSRETFTVRLRNHYYANSVCSEEEFVWIMTSWDTEISNDMGVWNFDRYFKMYIHRDGEREREREREREKDRKKERTRERECVSQKMMIRESDNSQILIDITLRYIL